MPRKNRAEFLFQGAPGDYISNGTDGAYNDADSVFKVYPEGKDKVRICIERNRGANSRTDDWNIEFAGPKGQRLKPGWYENAVRYAFQKDDKPGLSMSGHGRASNKSHGEFTIHRISWSKKAELVMLMAEFVHRDVGFAEPETYSSIPAVRGQVYYYKKPVRVTAEVPAFATA